MYGDLHIGKQTLSRARAEVEHVTDDGCCRSNTNATMVINCLQSIKIITGKVFQISIPIRVVDL